MILLALFLKDGYGFYLTVITYQTSDLFYGMTCVPQTHLAEKLGSYFAMRHVKSKLTWILIKHQRWQQLPYLLMIFGLFLHIFLDFLDELLKFADQLHVTRCQFFGGLFKHIPHWCKRPVEQMAVSFSSLGIMLHTHCTNKTENVLNMICDLTPRCVYSLDIRFILWSCCF